MKLQIYVLSLHFFEIDIIFVVQLRSLRLEVIILFVTQLQVDLLSEITDPLSFNFDFPNFERASSLLGAVLLLKHQIGGILTHHFQVLSKSIPARFSRVILVIKNYLLQIL